MQQLRATKAATWTVSHAALVLRPNHIVSQDLWLRLEEDLLPITALEEDFVKLLDEYSSTPPVAEKHELGDVWVAGEGGHVQRAPTVPACPAGIGAVLHHQLHQGQLAAEAGLLERGLPFRVVLVDVDPLWAGQEEAV